MRIYQGETLELNGYFSVIVIGRGNFEKKITQITITSNGDSNQIMITKNHQKSQFPSQMIADHQYPALTSRLVKMDRGMRMVGQRQSKNP